MIRNDDWFDRWPHGFDDEPHSEPAEVAFDEQMIEALRADVEALPGPADLPLGTSDPAVEFWRIALRQVADRERERRERQHRRVLYVIALLCVAAGPIIRLLARLPWRARSW